MAIRRLLTALLLCGAYSAAQNPPPSLTTIYNFTGGSDGADPTALTIGEGGVLYGAASHGGAYGYGTVFSLTPPASPGGSWTYTLLYSFQGGNDGEYPYSRLTIGTGGVLYGATTYGAFGSTEIYSLTPAASPGAPWTLAVIASFGTSNPSGVAISPWGVLFGTDSYAEDGATAFALVPPGSPGGLWTQQTVKNFGALSQPAGGLAIGAGLMLYGTIVASETVPEVFELAPPATPGGAWTETVIYQFTGINSDFPTDVAIGSGGVLYGAVYPQFNSGGTVYSLTPPVSPGGAWTQATLHEFPSLGYGDGPFPGPLTLGENGSLYGTTLWGGASYAGTAYALKPPASPGGAWTEIPLHTFTGSDGMYPTGLAIGSGGVLYGATSEGGAYGPARCSRWRNEGSVARRPQSGGCHAGREVSCDTGYSVPGFTATKFDLTG